MRALITNDDGVFSRGIAILAEAAVAAGLDVVVAAPHEERSGAGASLSALEDDGKLLVDAYPDLAATAAGLAGVPAHAVHATPAMIALVGALGAFGDRPDVVLSGINHGPNTGQATLHSGTVGAALTAVSMGVPGLAVSLDIDSVHEGVHWATARQATDEALAWFLKHLDGEPYVLNVNVPDIPPGELRGLKQAELAGSGAVQAAVGERGEGFVTMTFSGFGRGAAPGSDVALLRSGWATATAMTAPTVAAGVDLSSLG